jgi:hypothetical protein
MRGVRVFLSYATISPSANSTLLTSHFPSLRKTVISAARPHCANACSTCAVVARKIRVAVHDEKGLTEQRQRLVNRARRPTKFRTIERVRYIDPILPSISHEFPYHLSAIPDTKHDSLDPARF